MDKADKINNDHKLDKEDKAYRHTAITGQLRYRDILYLSVISQDILEEELYLNNID